VSICVSSIMFLISKASASEGQLWLDLNITGKHSRDYWWSMDDDGPQKHYYNEKNFGVGLAYGINDYIDLMGGSVFKNSYNKTSYYVGGNLKYPISLFSDTRLEIGVMVAGATGYMGTGQEKDTIEGILPYVIPNVTLIAEDTFYARVGWIPDLDGHDTSEYPMDDRIEVITLQFGVKLHPITTWW